jgi:hypothetical protein
MRGLPSKALEPQDSACGDYRHDTNRSFVNWPALGSGGPALLAVTMRSPCVVVDD